MTSSLLANPIYLSVLYTLTGGTWNHPLSGALTSVFVSLGTILTIAVRVSLLICKSWNFSAQKFLYDSDLTQKKSSKSMKWTPGSQTSAPFPFLPAYPATLLCILCSSSPVHHVGHACLLALLSLKCKLPEQREGFLGGTSGKEPACQCRRQSENQSFVT